MAAACRRPQPFGRALDVRQANGDIGVKLLPGLAQPHAPVIAQEQAHAQLRLQLGHRIGHSRLRHPQLARGGAETGQPSGSLEHHKGIQGRQKMAQRFHKHSLSTR